jgi:hypothetical protein
MASSAVRGQDLGDEGREGCAGGVTAKLPPRGKGLGQSVFAWGGGERPGHPFMGLVSQCLRLIAIRAGGNVFFLGRKVTCGWEWSKRRFDRALWQD